MVPGGRCSPKFLRKLSRATQRDCWQSLLDDHSYQKSDKESTGTGRDWGIIRETLKDCVETSGRLDNLAKILRSSREQVLTHIFVLSVLAIDVFYPTWMTYATLRMGQKATHDWEELFHCIACSTNLDSQHFARSNKVDHFAGRILSTMMAYGRSFWMKTSMIKIRSCKSGFNRVAAVSTSRWTVLEPFESLGTQSAPEASTSPMAPNDPQPI